MPSPTPVATAAVMQLSDLIADPITPVTADDLKAQDPGGWATADAVAAWKGTSTDQNPPGNESNVDLSEWLCTGAPFTKPSALDVINREMGCVVAITENWLRYIGPDHRDAGFTRARSIYEFAVGSLGATARARIDAALATVTVVPGSPASGLRTWAQFRAEKRRSPALTEFYGAVLGAVEADPALIRADRLMTLKFFLDSAGNRVRAQYIPDIVHCITRIEGSGDAVEARRDRVAACARLVDAAWLIYQATGSAAAYTAAVDAYNLGFVAVLGCPDANELICRPGWDAAWVSAPTTQ